MLSKANVTNIPVFTDLIEGSGRAHIRLPHRTQLFIEETLYSSRSKRNLHSSKDIRLDIILRPQMIIMWNTYFCITSNTYSQWRILKKLVALLFGLYHTTIKSVEAYHVMNQQFRDQNTFMLWHDRLGHPGSTMMRTIITNSKDIHCSSINFFIQLW